MRTINITVHPKLVESYEKLRKIANFTDGQIERVSEYLKPYMTEASQDADAQNNYANRKERLYHINNCDPFLYIHLSHMSQPITVTGWDGEKFDSISKDADGEGKEHQDMAYGYLWNYMRDGKVGILVDRTETPAPNQRIAIQNKEQSYQLEVESKDIVFWDLFTKGPNRGLFREVIIKTSSVYQGNAWVEQYSRFTIEEGAAFFNKEILEKKNGTLTYSNTQPQEMQVVDEKVGQLPFIPFVVMGDDIEESFLYSIVDNNAAHMNLGSVVSNIIYNQGFQRNILTGVRSDEIKKMGEWLVTTVQNPEAKAFTLDSGSPEAGFREKSELKNEIYRRGKFEFNQLADDTRQIQSAPSKERDMATRRKLYDTTLNKLRFKLRLVWTFHAYFEGEKNLDISVQIGDDYGLDDPTVEQAKMTGVFTKAGILGAVEVQRQVLKTELRQVKLIPNEKESEQDLLTRLDEDINSSGEPPEVDTTTNPNRPSIGSRFQ